MQGWWMFLKSEKWRAPFGGPKFRSGNSMSEVGGYVNQYPACMIRDVQRSTLDRVSDIWAPNYLGTTDTRFFLCL
jgi:hypothetical protein